MPGFAERPHPMAPVLLYKADGLVISYGLGATTDVARGTALKAASDAAATGDEIRLGPGTFDLGTDIIDVPEDGALIGAGVGATIIASDPDDSTVYCIVHPGSDSATRHLTIDGSSTTNYTFPWGASANQSAFTNAVLENVKVIGDTDGVYVLHSSNCSGTLRNVVAEVMYDGFRFGASSGTPTIAFSLYNCHATSAGPSVVATGNAPRGYAISGANTTINCYGCSSAATQDASTLAYSLEVNGGTVNVHGGSWTTVHTGSPFGGNSLRVIGAGVANLYSGFSSVTGVTVSVPLVVSDASSVINVGPGFVYSMASATSSGTLNKMTEFSSQNAGLLSGLTAASDRLPYFSSSSAMTLATFTSAGRALVGGADAATQRGTLAVNKHTVQFYLAGDDETLSTGDGTLGYFVPAKLNGAVITAVRADVQNTSGATFQIRRVRSGTPADVLSTRITIDSGETSSATADVAAVINGSNDDLATGDYLYLDVDAATATVGQVIVTVEATL